jgi:hypothetical protein
VSEVEKDDFDLKEFRLCILRFANEIEIDSKVWQCKPSSMGCRRRY